MAFWEFLIQKDGDRSWLPLESPAVEILEGRYRVVARSSQLNTPLEIRITHEAVTDFAPIRRVQKRTARTNRDGLVVIFPYTRLLPGTWELRCTGDLMADMLGEGWQTIVRLQVLPIESAVPDDWEPTLTETNAAITAKDISLTPTVPAANLDQVDQAASPEPPLTVPLMPVDPLVATNAMASSLEAEPIAELSDPPLISADVDSSQAVDVGIDAGEEVPLSLKDLRSSAVFQQAIQHVEQVVESAFQDLDDDPNDHEPNAAVANALGVEESATPAVRAVAPEPSIKQPVGGLFTAATADRAASWLRLVLDREMYVVQQGHPLRITGHIEPLDDLQTEPTALIGGLRVRLYDPHNAQVLVDEQKSLSDQTPPCPFAADVELPDHYRTYLLLGELALYSQPTADAKPLVIATQSFSVTTDLHELLEAIANDFIEPIALPQMELSVSNSKPATLNLDLLELANTPIEAEASSPYQPVPSQPLPPQLHPSRPQPEPPEPPAEPPKPRKSPTLPILVQPSRFPVMVDDELEADELESEAAMAATEPNSSSVDSPAAGTPAAPDAPTSMPAEANSPDLVDSQALDLALSLTIDAVPPVEVAAAVRADLPTVGPLPEPPAATDSEEFAVEPPPTPAMLGLIDDWADPLDWNNIEPRLPSWQRRDRPPVERTATPEDVAFRSLNLQDRFWSRLQALASDPELPSLLAVPSSVAEANVEVVDRAVDASHNPATDMTEPLATASSSNATSQFISRAIGLDAALADQEVVVEDWEGHASSPSLATSASDPPVSWALPNDEPIPAPVLELTTDELIAGKTINLTAQLPNLMPRIFVKFWLRDRQSRSLLGGPRWLVDFLPDGLGHLIARTSLTVPQGCLEVQIEAIAVEMTTLRESEKVSLLRKVLPSELSVLSIDELDV